MTVGPRPPSPPRRVGRTSGRQGETSVCDCDLEACNAREFTHLMRLFLAPGRENRQRGIVRELCCTGHLLGAVWSIFYRHDRQAAGQSSRAQILNVSRILFGEGVGRPVSAVGLAVLYRGQKQRLIASATRTTLNCDRTTCGRVDRRVPSETCIFVHVRTWIGISFAGPHAHAVNLVSRFWRVRRIPVMSTGQARRAVKSFLRLGERALIARSPSATPHQIGGRRDV